LGFSPRRKNPVLNLNIEVKYNCNFPLTPNLFAYVLSTNLLNDFKSNIKLNSETILAIDY